MAAAKDHQTPQTGAEAQAPRRGKPSARGARAGRTASNARKELVREKMLEKAAELFSTRGFARTSINEIADSLSLKRSSVYHYFSNKDAILRELFVDEYEQRLTEIEAVLARTGLTSHERLTLVIEGAIAQRLRSGGRFLVFDRLEAEVPEEMRRGYNRARRRILDLYTRVVDEGVKSGEFRAVEPRLAAFALIGMTNWTALWYSPSGKMKPAEIARALTGLLVYGISQREPGGGQPAATLGAVLANLSHDVETLRLLVEGTDRP